MRSTAGISTTTLGSCDAVYVVWYTWGATMPHCGRVKRNNRFCGHFVQKTAISCIPGSYELACVVLSPSNSPWTSPVPNTKNLFSS